MPIYWLKKPFSITLTFLVIAVLLLPASGGASAQAPQPPGPAAGILRTGHLSSQGGEEVTLGSLENGATQAPRLLPLSTAPVAPGELSAATNSNPLSLFQVSDLAWGSSYVNSPVSPSHATAGITTLATWNSYFTVSTDDGHHWGSYRDTSSAFPGSYGGFSGEQSVYYDPTHNLTFWSVGYLPEKSYQNPGDLNYSLANGGGIRIVWAGTDSLASYNFCYIDPIPSDSLGFTPDSGTVVYLETPRLVRSNNYIYLIMDAFSIQHDPSSSTDADDVWTPFGSAVIRINAGAIVWPPPAGNCGKLQTDYFITDNTLFGLGGVARGYGDMYLAGHVTGGANDTLRVYTWPETSAPNGITSADVTNTSYANSGYACPRQGGSAGDASDWCPGGAKTRHDDRIFTGWIKLNLADQSKNELDFLWDAAQDGSHPYPYIFGVRVKQTDPSQKLGEITLSSASYAYAYPSAAVNNRGDIGLTYLYGGGTKYESCGVGVLVDPSQPFELLMPATLAGNSDPPDANSGRYTATRMNPYGGGYTWSGSCYAPKGGDNHVYYIQFGHQNDYRSPFNYLPLIRK